MASNPQSYVTPEEYLEREERADSKSEYFNGEVFAMSGASPRHVLITNNISRELGNQLEGRRCAVMSSDLRVKVSETGLYTYPDVVVLCGKPLLDEKNHHTLLNPQVIVEVLSESTKNYDRAEKFEHYRTIDSFVEYVLVAQDKFHVEHFARQGDGSWVLRETNRLEDSIKLNSIGCELALARLYANYDFFEGE